jgi:hypothetical protein
MTNALAMEYILSPTATGMRAPGRMINVRDQGRIIMQMATNMREISRGINRLVGVFTLLPMGTGMRACSLMASFMARVRLLI